MKILLLIINITIFSLSLSADTENFLFTKESLKKDDMKLTTKLNDNKELYTIEIELPKSLSRELKQYDFSTISYVIFKKQEAPKKTIVRPSLPNNSTYIPIAYKEQDKKLTSSINVNKSELDDSYIYIRYSNRAISKGGVTSVSACGEVFVMELKELINE